MNTNTSYIVYCSHNHRRPRSSIMNSQQQYREAVNFRVHCSAFCSYHDSKAKPLNSAFTIMPTSSPQKPTQQCIPGTKTAGSCIHERYCPSCRNGYCCAVTRNRRGQRSCRSPLPFHVYLPQEYSKTVKYSTPKRFLSLPIQHLSLINI